MTHLLWMANSVNENLVWQYDIPQLPELHFKGFLLRIKSFILTHKISMQRFHWQEKISIEREGVEISHLSKLLTNGHNTCDETKLLFD